MRFKLQLEVNKRAFGNRLPINYQYEQSAAIYRILAREIMIMLPGFTKTVIVWRVGRHSNSFLIPVLRWKDTRYCVKKGGC